MSRKYRFVDILATLVADYLPDRRAQYKHMADDDFVTILSWLEDWEPMDVYDVAYEQSNLKQELHWDQWSENMTPLPVAVRAEMQSAIEKHEKLGNMKALRTYAFVYDTLFKWAKWTGIVALITFLYVWLW